MGSHNQSLCFSFPLFEGVFGLASESLTDIVAFLFYLTIIV